MIGLEILLVLGIIYLVFIKEFLMIDFLVKMICNFV